MALTRIVFHCADQDLFDLFIRSFPRPALLDPLRKDAALQRRHFRGYRISKSSPDLPAISKAYYREINEQRNEQLVDYLCHGWLLTHPEVATATLECLGLRDVLRQPGNWLPRARAALTEQGHVNAASEIARALAFAYPIEDILVVISILCVNCDQQPELRKSIEREFEKTHNDPGYLFAALTERQTRLLARLDDITKRVSDETTRRKSDLKPLGNELTKLTKKRATLDKNRSARETELEQTKNHLEQSQVQYEVAKGRMEEWKAKHDKIERAVLRAQAKFQELQYSRDALLADLDQQKKAVESECADVAERVEAAQKRMLDTKRDVVAPSDDTSPTGDTEIVSAEPACDLNDMLQFTALPGFRSSSVTIDMLFTWLRKRNGGTEVPPRHTDVFGDPSASVDYYGHMALYGERSWDATALGSYALARSLEDAPEGVDAYESRSDLLLGGLYHIARVSDARLVDRLLARLIELIPHQGIPRTSGLELADGLEILADCITDGAVNRRLGAMQTKLATANGQALQHLYDQMSPALRPHAKRALVSKVREARLQDTDPTHEVLDVVTTHLETLLAPLRGVSQIWGAEATLQDEVRTSKRVLLAGTAKLPHVFSLTTNDRLVQFRDLFAVHLKEALVADTLDGHELFRRLLLQYCLRDCRQPEWISSRYLFPIVVSLAQVASRADRKIRERKANIRLALEKQQHPLNVARRGVPLRIQLTNSGTATASEIHVEIEADRKEVAIRPSAIRLAKMGPEEQIWQDVVMDIADPVSAAELACLYHWKDPSGVQRVGDESVKLTAQRDVDWAKAQANPYSLRSITSQERLVGRDDDLEALRIGIEGTQSFCITGQKRVGKTSVARVLLKEFRDNTGHVAVYLTFGDLVATSWCELIYSLYEAIADELGDVTTGSRVELPPVEEFVVKQARYNRAFLRQLGSSLEGMKVLCIIDDFDEIDEGLYKGDDAKELFLRLRTLIDRGDFSFVMVGSEKLPDVLRHQGERLNQVQQHSLNYFRDKSSLRRLVVEPALPYLEYSEEAIDEIWEYSAGNPYYATQICVRVYGDMVTKRDHHVCPSDVQRNVNAICQDSNVSTFQHFWTDGVFEGGREMARLQYLNAAILTACARVRREKGAQRGVQRKALMAEPSLGSYDPAQIRFRLDNLVDRDVLVETTGGVRLRVPLFEKWLLARGEAAVRASFSEEALEVSVAPSIGKPAPRRIVEVGRDLVYQGAPLTEDRVRTWLDQFGRGENQDLALRLLESLKSKGYYSEASVYSRCKTLHELILQEFASGGAFAKVVEKRRIKNVFVSHFEGEGRSGGRILHVYRNANALVASLVGSMDEATRFVKGHAEKDRACAVVFVDDFVGTGGSCIDGLKLFQGKLNAVGMRLDRLVVGVAALVGVRAGVDAVRANDYIDCHVVTTDELGPEAQAFAAQGGVFEEEEDRNAARRLCEGIGRVLEPKQPLGFGDCQALVCFSHRCPNNTLPIFYKKGMMYQGREWIPLFPR